MRSIRAAMPSGRLEAFSDGFFAVIITIMVLELRAPHESDLRALLPLVPSFCSYVLSFTYLGIYWNNHHHMFQATEKISGGALLANLHLLFWLSLFPFVTDWMGETHLAVVPTACYGTVLLFAALAYLILQRTILRGLSKDSPLARAVGSDIKGKISPLFYAAGVALSFFWPWLAMALYWTVAVMWIVPDPRIERTLARE